MVDVTVRGAGIFGLSVAWACALRGARVRVVDPFGVAAGASGGLVGALAPHVPENWNDKKDFQFRALVRAEAFWEEVSAISSVDPGYARTGRLQPLADDHAVELAQQRAKTAQELWGPRFSWSVTSDVGRFAPHSPTGLWIHDNLSARLHPRKATQALAMALQAKGTEIVQDAPTQGAEVWATGVHDLDAMSAAAGRTLGNGVKGQAALLKFDAPHAPQLFGDALHLVPHADGTLAIGSTSERSYDNPTQTDDQLDDVLTRAVAVCPALATAPVLARWAGVRPRARSRAPVLGHHPMRDGAYIANGGFKIGFGIAPEVGEVMAELILNQCNTIPQSFAPEAL
ncbi:NAD(P)/FAD-dependent oxidoreductase [Primorskyibacter sp. S187A]|uniref:NAD(P)/FAD-dependent oxidoreductase n=1 Tax=Primorskyibacter sp. S187A TaxID=3415130 RepID=UPI003C7C73FB